MTPPLITTILEHPDFQPKDDAYVSVYRTEQCYGGPEEGGWWYSVNTLQGSIKFPSIILAEEWLASTQSEIDARNAADAPGRYRAMENLPDHNSAYHDEGYIPAGWSDGGELWTVIEGYPGLRDNSEDGRPHYE